MSENKFKTLRHIETVRNYLSCVIFELLQRSSGHDQSKLQTPEVEIFEEYTPKLRGVTYGSDEYKAMMKEMKVAIDHHNSVNRHHPEHFENGVNGMNLIDLLEMMCDWKAASLRHSDGDIIKSIKINKDRFGISDQLETILINTAKWIDTRNVIHFAQES